LTSRQLWQMSAMRFLACVSSSPSTTSKMRSYHFAPSWYCCNCCGMSGGGREGMENAFGANSSLGSSDGCIGLVADSGGIPERFRRGCPGGPCGPAVGARWILAVGGGANPVLGPCGVLCLLSPPSDFRFLSGRSEDCSCRGDPPPYLSSSCCVLSYFVADLSLLMAASRCLTSSLRDVWLWERR